MPAANDSGDKECFASLNTTISIYQTKNKTTAISRGRFHNNQTRISTTGKSLPR
jgi:hypothetical protein